MAMPGFTRDAALSKIGQSYLVNLRPRVEREVVPQERRGLKKLLAEAELVGALQLESAPEMLGGVLVGTQSANCSKRQRTGTGRQHAPRCSRATH